MVVDQKFSYRPKWMMVRNTGLLSRDITELKDPFYKIVRVGFISGSLAISKGEAYTRICIYFNPSWNGNFLNSSNLLIEIFVEAYCLTLFSVLCSLWFSMTIFMILDFMI